MARRQWAKVLRLAERGTPVEVTKNGHPVAALVSIEQLRKLEGMPRQTLSEVVARFRERIDEKDLAGPDPWREVRDRSPGRDVGLG
jgi:prevent-host-death family protein